MTPLAQTPRARRVGWLSVHAIGNPEPLVACVDPATIVIRRIAPRLARNPSRAVRIIICPRAVLIRRPAVVHTWSPRVAIVIKVHPVAVIVEIIQTGNRVRRVLVTLILPIGIVVVGVAQVGVVVNVPTVVLLRVSLAIVIVDEVTRIVRLQAREDNLRRLSDPGDSTSRLCRHDRFLLNQQPVPTR